MSKDRITSQELVDALKEIVMDEERVVLHHLENCLANITNFEARRLIERVIRESEGHLIKTTELLTSMEKSKPVSQISGEDLLGKLEEGLGYEREALKKYEDLLARVEDAELKKVLAHFRNQEAEHIKLIRRAMDILSS